MDSVEEIDDGRTSLKKEWRVERNPGGRRRGCDAVGIHHGSIGRAGGQSPELRVES